MVILMQFQKDFLSAIKFKFIFNYMRRQKTKISLNDIPLVAVGTYVSLDKSVNGAKILIIKQLNRAFEYVLTIIENRKTLNKDIINEIISRLLINSINYNFLAENYIAFLNMINDIKWKQLSLFSFNETLAKIVIYIQENHLFNDFENMVTQFLCLTLPLFYKIPPMLFSVQEWKDLLVLVENNDVPSIAKSLKNKQVEMENQIHSFAENNNG